MSLPGFNAHTIVNKQERTHRSRAVSRSKLNNVEPAAPDSREQAYRECLVDCRAAGGRDCPQLCSGHSSGGSAGTSSGVTSPSTVCQIEMYTHPIGTAIMDATVRAARDSGTIRNKADCYQWADIQAGITGAVASGVGNYLGGFLGGFLGAAVGFNSYTLSHCICDKYF